MKLQNLENRSKTGYTTFGSYWKKGEFKENIDDFCVMNDWKKKVQVQSRISAYWPDGSVKWAAHTADASKLGKSITIDKCTSDLKNEGLSKIIYKDQEKSIIEDTGCISMEIPIKVPTDYLAKNIYINGVLLIKKIYPILVLERRDTNNHQVVTIQEEFMGVIESVNLEEQGPLTATYKFTGYYANENETSMRFVIRMTTYYQSSQITFQNSFQYDGEESKDFLKGLGIRFEAVLGGEAFNRHIKITTDESRSFHETATLLSSSHPRIAPEILNNQMDGDIQKFSQNSVEIAASKDLPIWNDYSMCQDSAFHFKIRKRTFPDCCWLTGKEGTRSEGGIAVVGENGGAMIASKDFWQKNPAGFQVDGLAHETTNITTWFYSPEYEAFDFRHYDKRSYPLTSYEGYPDVRATAFGISVTSEASIALIGECPTDQALDQFVQNIQKPPLYIGSSFEYHDLKAFGTWSLPKKNTESEEWIEKRLEEIFGFYKQEIENRTWYGLFDYGDVMHKYDDIRHTWRYDVGGFAWQNTELIPTYWLWYYFLRTNDESAFEMAEAMTRHCSEVDFYHFGPLKGIGSRHNVRHWGCSCKEPRISMAGHHRFYYYLTGDLRMKDIFDDVKEADYSMRNVEGFMRPEIETPKEDFIIRTGPDWTSFLANWMTWYEQTLDPSYKAKILNGIDSIYNAPLKLASGPDYRFNSETGKLTYIGEIEDTPNMHLLTSMGGAEVFMELVEMFDDKQLKEMMIEYGRFYMLSSEEKTKESGGLIRKRHFAFPYFCAALGAYAAKETNNKKLAETVWQALLGSLINETDISGFKPSTYSYGNDGKEKKEIPWISTNFVSQWCVNVIICLELIGDYLPETIWEMQQLISIADDTTYHKA